MKLITNSTGSNLRPDAVARAVVDIDFDYWKSHGITTVCVDLDSTLLPHGGAELDAANLRRLKQQPLPIIIATNRLGHEGVLKVVSELEAAHVITADSWLSKKPSRAYFRKVINASGSQPSRLLMIGDRAIQDIWGANRAGLQTVMIDKLGYQPLREKLLGAIDRWWWRRMWDLEDGSQ